MLRVDLRNAKPGMTLALPVPNPKAPNQVLLRVGYSLTDSILTKLEELETRCVWVDYPALDYLREYIDPAQQAAKGEVLSQITSVFAECQESSTAKLDYDQYTQSIGGLIDNILANPKTALFMNNLTGEQGEDDLMRHSAAVTHLSLLIGLRLEGYLVRQRKRVAPERAKEVTSLGVGAMLHDLGLSLLPPAVRNHYLETGDESDPSYREHTALGFRTVRGQIEPSAATILLNHHQRYDGTGFAGKNLPVLEGESIHIFARIVGAAAHFERMKHPPGLDERPAVFVLGAMLSEPTVQQFDPQVLRALVEVTPPFPPGTVVRLSDDRWAATIDHDAAEPCRPKLQALPPPDQIDPNDPELGEVIDLRQEPATLRIVEADGQPVEEFLFDGERVPGNEALADGWGASV
ncbi:MAG: HD domain-containing phosphohydrolase [Planctomycetota bacterium]